MKAKHRNSNRSNSSGNSAESESVLRLILIAVFEEIVFSRRNFFSVIFEYHFQILSSAYSFAILDFRFLEFRGFLADFQQFRDN